MKHLVVFTPSGKRGQFETGTPVLEAAQKLGVDLDSVCGGRGICSKCQVTPSFGDFPKHGVSVDQSAVSTWNAIEQRYHDKRGLKANRRLGCQLKIQGDLVVDVPAESQVHKQVIRKAASSRHIEMNPATKLYYVEVLEPDMHEPKGDLERLKTALSEQWKIDQLDASLSIVKELQSILRKGEWSVTVAVNSIPSENISRILKIWPGYHEASIYGLAIDLGSTTIAAHLTDLGSGKVIGSSGVMNPQIRFGEDLMSRVSYAMMNADGAEAMTAEVRKAIDKLVIDLAESASIKKEDILEAVFVCNPVMHHLLLGIDPAELGQAPFALATSESIYLNAKDLNLLSLIDDARIYLCNSTSSN